MPGYCERQPNIGRAVKQTWECENQSHGWFDYVERKGENDCKAC